MLRCKLLYNLLHIRHDESNPLYQKKFLVYGSNLLSLFAKCFQCHSPAAISTKTKGSFLQIKSSCPTCAFQYSWTSQPFITDKPEGNLALSAAIICSGPSPSKVNHLLKIINCQSISNATFFKYQRQYLHPSISHNWRIHQEEILSLLHSENKPLILGGDARCDSPGYCAKFGSYTLLELNHNVIVDVELVQVRAINTNDMHIIILFRVMRSKEVHIWKKRDLFVEFSLLLIII